MTGEGQFTGQIAQLTSKREVKEESKQCVGVKEEIIPANFNNTHRSNGM